MPYLINLTDDKSFEVSEKSKELLRKLIREKYYNWDYEDGITIVMERKYDDLGQYNIPLSVAYNLLDEYIADHPESLRFAEKK